MQKRIAALIAGVVIIAVPVALYDRFKYKPALSPATGYQAQWLNPPPFYARVYYTTLDFGDVRPCEYTLTGWLDNATLVFRWSCDNNTAGVVAHNVEAHSAQRLDAAPARLIVHPVAKLIALEWMRADGVRPVGYESITRPLMGKGDGLLSPDGKRLAVIVHDVYGPEDVLVLSKNDGSKFTHSSFGWQE